MSQVFSRFAQLSQPTRQRVLRLALVLAAGTSLLVAGVAWGQDGRTRNGATFDDAISDSESYPFDSNYDANYGRNRPEDPQHGWSHRSASEKQIPGRHVMGFRLRATEEGMVFVDQVFRGGAGDRAGLRPGDKVLAIDGYEVGSREDVTRALRHHRPGEKVEMIIARFGRTREIDVPLPGKWSDPAEIIAKGVEEFTGAVGQAASEIGSGVRRFSHAMQQDVRDRLDHRPRASVRDPYDRFSDDAQGTQTDIDDETSDHSGEPKAVIEIDVIPPDHIKSVDRGERDLRGRGRRTQADDNDSNAARREHAVLGITVDINRDQGVVVTAVHPDGPAEQAGLRRGDRIVRIDGRKIDDVAQLVRYLQRQQPGDDVEVQVDRNGWRRSFFLTLVEAGQLRPGGNKPELAPDQTKRGSTDRRREEAPTLLPSGNDLDFY